MHFNVQGITYKMWQEDEQLKTGSTQMSQRTYLLGFLRRALVTENDKLKLNIRFLPCQYTS